MQGMWRVHCFKVFGGEDWLKILLALGHCRQPVIQIANDILARRIDVKASRLAATQTMTGPKLAARTQAAMDNQKLPEIKPPGSSTGNKGKQFRDEAKKIKRKLRFVSCGFG